MAESPSTKVHLSVPAGYRDLPKDQRLAEAAKLATAIQARLRRKTSDQPDDDTQA